MITKRRTFTANQSRNFYRIYSAGRIRFELRSNARRLTLKDVELNKDYALILTTNSGLWAYSVVDVVRLFLKIRTEFWFLEERNIYLNFGEHVIAFEVEEAIKQR